MPDNNAYIEKRQHERLAARIKLSYALINDAEVDQLVGGKTYQDISLNQGVADPGKVKDVMTVITENISVSGLMIVGQQPFKAGQSMRLELVLPQVPLPVKCLAVVVRGSEAPREGQYSAGVRFLAINKDDVAKIQRYIVLQKRAELERRS